jgi:hypothetical protein
MNGAMSGIREELAAAVRAVNAAFNRLPLDAQEEIEICYDGLDAEIDASIRAEDRPRAVAAIRAFRDHWVHELARAAEEGRHGGW